MELRHLRYAVAVADCGHMTRAAERIGIRQPPLSQQIAALERELGFALFLRHARGVTPTPGGQAFVVEARAILARVDAAARSSGRVARGLEGELLLGLTSSAAAHPVVPRMIRKYRERFPQVALRVTDGSAADLSAAVERQALDLALIRAPVSASEHLACCHLLNEDLLLVVPLGHPLLRKVRRGSMPTVPIEKLKGEALILVRRPGATGMYSSLLDACRKAGFEPPIAAEIDRMLPNVSLVAAGVGLSVVPGSMRRFLDDQVVYCRVGGVDPPLVAPLTIVSRRGEPPPVERNFIDAALAVVAGWKAGNVRRGEQARL